jgi:hypothetical protein
VRELAAADATAEVKSPIHHPRPVPPDRTFVIYHRPSTASQAYSVTEFDITAGAAVGTVLHATLDQARQSVPRGLVRVPRDPADDASVVETWMDTRLLPPRAGETRETG